MTQHLMHEQELEDQRTLRRLGAVIAGFVVATAVMAVAVGAIMG